mgnify:CR=1
MPLSTLDSSASSAQLPSRFSDADSFALQMPLDEAPEDFGQMVNQLETCDPEDLRRARRHHRRALEALRNGCYEALCEDTRSVLIGRLQADLDALNRVLRRASSGSPRVPQSWA